MNDKVTILGFVAGAVVWFAVAVGTLMQLDEVADNAVTYHAQTTPAPAAPSTPASPKPANDQLLASRR